MQVMPVVDGKYPRVKVRYLPMPCMHCEHPPCTKVCPVHATYQNEEGITAQIWDRCIGCRYCTVACPYTRRFFNWYAPSWPEVMKKQLNPEVSVRPKGVVEKCLFCIHRIRKVKDKARKEAKEKARKEGRPFREEDVVIRDEDVIRLPACCQTCPSEALYFGDLNDPKSTVSKLAQSRRAFQLQEDLGTHPKVYYLAEGDLR